ncbi:hypothetical protein [Flavobacterium wongokense]|uniref:hypothetical protein n=1 Tax=Flavobacterium wongokense TaxID=2910674 RepID=UPI001F34E3B6|nr:hypothetical protein [Flavobacterium sp. WG47]MCF6130766.1 hypothetical protein [Flavobacterium sp. WG47]
MKKLFSLIIAIIFFSCSEDSGCENKIYGFEKIPNEQGVLLSYITYGRNPELAIRHEVNNTTYDYYFNLQQQNENPICWGGSK